MIRISLVGVTSWKTAQKRLTSVERALALAPRSLVTRAGYAFRSALKAAAPVGPDRFDYHGHLTHRGGELRRSIGFRSLQTPAGAGAAFYANRTAIFVIGGTRPHEIWAGIFTGGGKGKLALSWPGARHPVTHVKHPGTKKNDFRKKAWATASPEVRGILRQTGRAIFRGESLGAEVSL